jgi:uncharacterized membrane protein
MAWLLAILVGLGVVTLICAFTINARSIMRDMRMKLDGFRARLEHDATSMVDELMNAQQGEDLDEPPGK